ncbi:hypothetical protein [Nonomuraea sp. NPDC052265]|uniref:hypothetical protein n=1 Tax=Nonomuraea sp. NPDC052265 TaxID=3364374 RepID=UPI0037C69364
MRPHVRPFTPRGDEEAMLIQVTMRQVRGMPILGSPIDGIRIMALLPGHWHKDLTQAGGDIVIRMRVDEPLTSAQVRAEVTQTLANPEVDRWELVACRVLSHSSTAAREEDQ